MYVKNTIFSNMYGLVSKSDDIFHNYMYSSHSAAFLELNIMIIWGEGGVKSKWVCPVGVCG